MDTQTIIYAVGALIGLAIVGGLVFWLVKPGLATQAMQALLDTINLYNPVYWFKQIFGSKCTDTQKGSKAAGEGCIGDCECQSGQGCGHMGPDGNRVCCKNGTQHKGVTGKGAMGYYCQSTPNGTPCSRDWMCASGNCKDGTCASIGKQGDACDGDSNCQHECGHVGYNMNTKEKGPRKCCQGDTGHHFSTFFPSRTGYYCRGEPKGTGCLEGWMCASGKCKDNVCQ